MSRPKIPRPTFLGLCVLASALIMAGVSGYIYIHAQQGGGSPDSGVNSRPKTLYNTLSALGYGTDTNTPDWGTDWDRIATSATWAPSGNAATTDVRSGKTYYSATRTQQTGTYPAPTSCATEVWHDNYGAPVTETTNCSLTWTTAVSPVSGDDDLSGRGGKDPRTGLIWSQLLWKNGTAVQFSHSSNTAFSWDSSAAANQGLTAPASGSRTAIQLCSDQGNGWRLPTQKELMQAYVDGSYFNLTQPSTNFWSATQYSATNAWYVGLYNGYTYTSTFATTNQVRCVRPGN